MKGRCASLSALFWSPVAFSNAAPEAAFSPSLYTSPESDPGNTAYQENRHGSWDLCHWLWLSRPRAPLQPCPSLLPPPPGLKSSGS